jgi:hypothetical protein
VFRFRESGEYRGIVRQALGNLAGLGDHRSRFFLINPYARLDAERERRDLSRAQLRTELAPTLSTEAGTLRTLIRLWAR